MSRLSIILFLLIAVKNSSVGDTDFNRITIFKRRYMVDLRNENTVESFGNQNIIKTFNNFNFENASLIENPIQLSLENETNSSVASYKIEFSPLEKVVDKIFMISTEDENTLFLDLEFFTIKKYEDNVKKNITKLEFKLCKDFTFIFINVPSVICKQAKTYEPNDLIEEMDSKMFLIFQSMFHSFFRTTDIISDFLSCWDFTSKYSKFFTLLDEVEKTNKPIKLLISSNKRVLVFNFLLNTFNLKIEWTILKVHEVFTSLGAEIFADEVKKKYIILNIFQDVTNILLLVRDKDYEWKEFIFHDCDEIENVISPGSSN